MPFFSDNFGNASSVHKWGQRAKAGIDEARKKTADLIGAAPQEIFFTSSGTESDNLAIRGAAARNRGRKNHIITSAIEHHAVLHSCEALEKNGFRVTYLPVDKYGMVDPDDVKKSIGDDTFLVTIMHGQNEVGTIQPIEEIASIARSKGVLFHTDAVQSAGLLQIDVKDMNIDLLTLSGHKMYGPKGVAALYVRRGVRLEPQITGGAHERGLRAGTENVTGIVGLGEACYQAKQNLAQEGSRLRELRDHLISGILNNIPNTVLNGHPTKRLPHNVNISVKSVEGEAMLLNLDLLGIGASSGSACTSGSLEPSHVLLAMGVPHELAHGSLRMTLGKSTTKEDLDYVISVLPPIVKRLRDMSAL